LAQAVHVGRDSGQAMSGKFPDSIDQEQEKLGHVFQKRVFLGVEARLSRFAVHGHGNIVAAHLITDLVHGFGNSKSNSQHR